MNMILQDLGETIFKPASKKIPPENQPIKILSIL